MAWNPNGSYLASASEDAKILLWDVQDGKQIVDPLDNHELSVWSVAWHPDGNTVVSASEDGTVRLWDVKSGIQLGEELRGDPISTHSRIMKMRKNQRILSLGDRLFRSDGPEQLSLMDDHSDLFDRGFYFSVTCVAWSPDGTQLISGSNDGTIRFWDAECSRFLPNSPDLSVYFRENWARFDRRERRFEWLQPVHLFGKTPRLLDGEPPTEFRCLPTYERNRRRASKDSVQPIPQTVVLEISLGVFSIEFGGRAS